MVYAWFNKTFKSCRTKLAEQAAVHDTQITSLKNEKRTRRSSTINSSGMQSEIIELKRKIQELTTQLSEFESTNKEIHLALTKSDNMNSDLQLLLKDEQKKFVECNDQNQALTKLNKHLNTENVELQSKNESNSEPDEYDSDGIQTITFAGSRRRNNRKRKTAVRRKYYR